MARPERHAGFTLIELLVVVVIITVLIALLIPAISRAKMVALRTVCASNLRGVGVGFEIYSNDWNGAIIENFKDNISGDGNLYPWGSVLGYGADPGPGNATALELIHPTYVDPKIMHCPLTPDLVAATTPPTTPPTTYNNVGEQADSTYGMYNYDNSHDPASSPGQNAWHNWVQQNYYAVNAWITVQFPKRVPSPGNTMFMADTLSWPYFAYSATTRWGGPEWCTYNEGSKGQTSIWAAHGLGTTLTLTGGSGPYSFGPYGLPDASASYSGGTINMMYYDGHVESNTVHDLRNGGDQQVHVFWDQSQTVQFWVN